MSDVVQRTNTERSNSTGAETGRSWSGETARKGFRESLALTNSPMQKFIGEQNISRFVEQFPSAHDPYTRKRLQTLLIEEENKFGFNSEQLESLQQRIKECKGRIDQHERLIRRARANGHDTSTAERVLNNLVELQEVFWSQHQVVLETLNRSKL